VVLVYAKTEEVPSFLRVWGREHLSRGWRP
jgi:hypothetical protein